MSSNKRIKGLSVSRPIYYGNTAVPLTGKKASDSNHTHKWTVMVKGLNGIEQPPFELTETGWGEFEIMIKIHFQPITSEKAVTLYHHLQLHPYEDDLNGQSWPKDKPVTSLIYDELVFNEPTEAFREVLQKHNALTPNIPAKKSTKDPLTQFSLQLEKEELERLDAAQQEVNAQIISLKQRMAALDGDS
ncbi:unnamed protein product [Cunninghamella echinulata]